MKKKKNKKKKKVVKIGGAGIGVGLAIIAIIFLGIFLSYNLNKKNNNSENWDRYAIIGKQNLVVVYEDKLAVKIPFEVQADKKNAIKDLIKLKNYDVVIQAINNFLPEKVEHYKVVKYSGVDLKVKNLKSIPEIVIEGKRYILTSGTKSLFADLYKGEAKYTQNLVVDILNANGVVGYAKKTGDKLKEKLSLTYTAANYEANTEYSLIKINEITREDLENILVNVNEKYFKVKTGNDIPTLASVVLVLGKEEEIDFKIVVKGNAVEIGEISKSLQMAGYKNVVMDEVEERPENTVIEYNGEDYYTALKLAKKLQITNMLENNDLKTTIIITVN